jgi:hypothetical protein
MKLPEVTIAKESKLKPVAQAVWSEKSISAMFGTLGNFGNLKFGIRLRRLSQWHVR